MNPGAIEEGSKVAASFLDAMKGQPLALALVICNIMLLVLFFYVARWAGTNRSDEFKAIMEMQREVQMLLYNCTPTRPNG